MHKKAPLFKIIQVEQESYFDRQARMDWWDQDKLNQACFLIVGTGAIGNETIKNLVLLGARRLLLCDYDHISPSNLSRTVLFRSGDVGRGKAEVAAARAQEMALAADIQIDVFKGDIVWELGYGVFARMAMALGCLDNVETRLAVNRRAMGVGIPFIDAGIQALCGSVAVFGTEGPCYECITSESRRAAARARYSCDEYKKRLFEAGKVPTVQVASALVSAIQVQEAVKYLNGQNTLAGQRLFVDGQNNQYMLFELQRREDCQGHQPLGHYTSLPLGTEHTTLRDFLCHVSTQRPGALDIGGRFLFVHTDTCRKCGQRIAVNRPVFRLFDDEVRCTDCGGSLLPIQAKNPAHRGKEEQSLFSLQNTPAEVLDMTLHQLGVPYLDIVRVAREDGSIDLYELSADESVIFRNIAL